VEVVGDEGRAHSTDEDVAGNGQGDEVVSGVGRHSSQAGNGCGGAGNEHGGDDDVGSLVEGKSKYRAEGMEETREEAKGQKKGIEGQGQRKEMATHHSEESEGKMRRKTGPPRSKNLEVSVGVRGVHLELRGVLSEEQHLHGSSGSVPPCSRDTHR
jgi:hypothetical protein